MPLRTATHAFDRERYPMHLIRSFLHFILHLDTSLPQLIQNYGGWTYAILIAIVFCETGLVITPFLPGDSMLFVAGSVAAEGGLNFFALAAALAAAAIAGDTVNYQVGKAIGPRVMKSETSRLLNKKHLDRTHKFFEKHGGKTIILARFVPIVRTFAPFVAGAGAMSYGKFIVYNITGAIAWVGLMVGAGFLFGKTEIVHRNFSKVIILIIFVSILPGLIEYLRARREHRAAAGTAP